MERTELNSFHLKIAVYILKCKKAFINKKSHQLVMKKLQVNSRLTLIFVETLTAMKRKCK